MVDAWLDPAAGLAEIEPMLTAADEATLRMWPVSTEVNRVAADGAHLLRAVDLSPTLGLA
jgi:putative SOS response-associated peptidase YedK